MPSFKAVLQVSGKQYDIRYSEFTLQQLTDELGRPASPKLASNLLLHIDEPDAGDSVLFEWAISPVMQLNGQFLAWDLDGIKLTVIKFYHAFLVDFENHFEGTGQGGAQPSQQVRLRISPQAVDNNGNFHDNDWPKPDPIVDWNWTTMDQQCTPPAVKPKAEDEPSLLSQIGDALTNLTQQLPALQPKAKGMTGEGDMRPEDPGRTPDEKAPRPFNPGRTPDYPSADKPSLPTIADRVEQIEKVADWLFGDDNNGSSSGEKGGSVAKNELEPHEYEQALAVTDRFGGHIEGQTTKKQAGIDGTYNGKPISLKETDSSSPMAVLRNVSKSEGQISKAGYKGVDVYVKAKNMSGDQLIDFAKNGGLKDIPNQGTVDTIYVETSNGWVKIDKNGVSKIL